MSPHVPPTTRFTGRDLRAMVEAALSTRSSGEGVGVVIGRLDRAELICEVLGPETAEAVADELVEHVAGAVRSGDTVGRFGRHGWYVVVEGLPSWRDLELVVDRVIAASRQPAGRSGLPDHLTTTSVGAAVTHDPLASASALLGQADRACREATAAGGDRYRRARATPGDGPSSLELAHDLRRGLARWELELTVQAMVPVRPGPTAPDGERLEALIRWNHPRRGALHPTVFGPAAVGVGLGPALGGAILDLVCREIAASARRGEPATLSVDVDPAWFDGGDDQGGPVGAGMVEAVSAAVAGSGVDPRRLQLELDAGALMARGAGPWPALARLPAMGVGLALDHLMPSVGTFEWLALDPGSTVWKLDRSVAEHLGSGPSRTSGRDLDEASALAGLARAGVEAVVSLARTRGVEIVALGVDRPGIVPALAGVDLLQGLAVSRPEQVRVPPR